MFRQKKPAFQILLCIAMTTIASGCLKTRAQLKEDGDPARDETIPGQITEVQPQGQYIIDEIKSEITRLTGRIEDLERARQEAMSTNTAAEQEQAKKLEERVVQLEQAQASMIEAIKKIQASLPMPDETEVFEKGKAHLLSKEYEPAIDALTAYLKNPKGKHAEEATILRGDAYYELKQYKKAIIDYSKLPEKFQKSKRIPAALFKIGLSFEALGLKEDAKSFFQELTDKYPKSAEAKKAKPKLKLK